MCKCFLEASTNQEAERKIRKKISYGYNAKIKSIEDKLKRISRNNGGPIVIIRKKGRKKQL